MNFNELKQLISEGKEYNLNIDKFLTLSQKANMIDEFMKIVIKEESGLHSVDRYKYEVMLIYFTLNWFGNITFEEVEIDDNLYDFAMQSGLFDKIVTEVGFDFYRFKQLLDDCILEELKIKNSIEGIISRGITSLLDKIPSETKMEDIIKQIQNIEPEKLGLLSEVLKFNNPAKPKKTTTKKAKKNG